MIYIGKWIVGKNICDFKLFIYAKQVKEHN